MTANSRGNDPQPATLRPSTHQLGTALAPRPRSMDWSEANRPTGRWTFSGRHVNHLKVVEANRRWMVDRKWLISPGGLQNQQLLSPMNLCPQHRRGDRNLSSENFGQLRQPAATRTSAHKLGRPVGMWSTTRHHLRRPQPLSVGGFFPGTPVLAGFRTLAS